MATNASVPPVGNVVFTTLPPVTLYHKVSHFLLTHERLLLALVAAGLIWYGTGKVEAIIAAHDQHNLTVAQAQLAATHDANLAKVQAADAAALAAQQAKVQAEAYNAKLEAANAALTAALAKQKAVDAMLPPAQLADHIVKLADAPAGSVTPAPGGYAVTQPGAVAVAQKLEEVDPLKQQLANSQAETASTGKALVACTTATAAANQTVGGLQTELKQKDGVCQEQLKVQADKNRKKVRKAGVFGAIAGFFGHMMVSRATGGII